MLKGKSKIAVLICTAMIVGQFSLGVGQPVFKDSNTVSAKEVQQTKKVKNVIMMIPDGMSIEITTLARWYNDLKIDGVAGNDFLALDKIQTGLVRTHWADGPITDSAPGGTAYAIGQKTDDKHVGVLPGDKGNRPLASILEAAKLSGKATGIVATSESMHATPADFTAHVANRAQYNSIMKQQVYSGLDVMFAGGDRLLSSDANSAEGESAVRNDGVDLRENIKDMDYSYITTKDEMDKLKTKKVWGMFADAELKYDFDKESEPTQPSLEDMTKKSLDILSKDKNGFFLMVEGSKIDWAAHDNDPTGVVSDTLSFDKAVHAAVEFAKKDGNTVVVVAADHGTGGMTIGYDEIGEDIEKDYPSISFDDYLMKITNVNETTDKVSESLEGADVSKIIADVKKYYGLEKLTAEEIASIKEGNLNKVLSKNFGVGWTTGGHTGGDVSLYNYAPKNIEKLTGVVDNTDVNEYMARVMGLNLEKATQKLFQNAEDAFKKVGASVTLDVSDIDNPVVNIRKNGQTMKLNSSTNIGEFNGEKVDFEGVTVCISEDGKIYDLEDVYAPKDAVEKFEAYVKAGKVVKIKK